MAFGPDTRYTTGAPGWGRTATADAAAVDAGLRSYMLRVYNWMASGLLLTGIVAYECFERPVHLLFRGKRSALWRFPVRRPAR